MFGLHESVVKESIDVTLKWENFKDVFGDFKILLKGQSGFGGFEIHLALVHFGPELLIGIVFRFKFSIEFGLLILHNKRECIFIIYQLALKRVSWDFWLTKNIENLYMNEVSSKMKSKIVQDLDKYKRKEKWMQMKYFTNI